MTKSAFDASLSVIPPGGAEAGSGSVRTVVEYRLSDNEDRIEVVSEGVTIEITRLNLPGVENPVIGGTFHVQVDAWGIDGDVRTTMTRRPQAPGGYKGDFYVVPIPEKLRALIEGRAPVVALDATHGGSVASKLVERPAGRPLSAAVSLIEAKEHIDDAKALIQKYINAEPEPDDFGLAVLEALLREVDNLGE